MTPNRTKVLLTAVVITLLIVQPALAKPLEPVSDYPRWATPECLKTIARIVQHETLHTRSVEVYRFLAEQVVYDLRDLPCSALTRWRWAIGDYHPSIDRAVNDTVSEVILAWPEVSHPRCQYVGYPGDLAVWPGELRVDIRFERRGLVVIGVNCQ